MAARPLLLGLLFITLSVAACRKNEVTSYRVPKEKEPVPSAAPTMPPAGGNMAATAVPTTSGPKLTWTAPARWKSIPPTPSREATYMIPDDGGAEGELAITAFAGNVGGELANVNRWRGQPPFQLPPIGEAEMAAAVVRFEHNGLKFGLLELVSTGSPKSRLLGAWVPFGSGTWFFKFTGPDALVAKEKAAFLAFLETVKPATGAP
jgi:hypothetical protein